MNNEESPKVKMILPCVCPHCGEQIVIKIDLPSPEIIDVVKSDEIEDDIKNLINGDVHDSTETDTTA